MYAAISSFFLREYYLQFSGYRSFTIVPYLDNACQLLWDVE